MFRPVMSLIAGSLLLLAVGCGDSSSTSVSSTGGSSSPTPPPSPPSSPPAAPTSPSKDSSATADASSAMNQGSGGSAMGSGGSAMGSGGSAMGSGGSAMGSGGSAMGSGGMYGSGSPGMGPQGSGMGPQGSGMGPQGSGGSAMGSGGMYGSGSPGMGPQGSGMGPQGSGMGPQGSGMGPQGSGMGPQGSGMGPGGSAMGSGGMYGSGSPGMGPQGSGMGPQGSGGMYGSGNPGMGMGPGGMNAGAPGYARQGAGMANAVPPEPVIPELREEADLAMSEGYEKDAFNYLYAAILADEDSELLQQYKWVDGLKRPVLAVRWGIGLEVTLPRRFKGEYYPVGTDQPLPERTRGNQRRGRQGRGGRTSPGGAGSSGYSSGPSGMSSGMDGMGPGPNNAPTNAAQELETITGELGQRFLDHLQQGILNGDYGEVLADMGAGAQLPASGRGRGTGAGSGYSGGSSMMMPGAMGSSAMPSGGMGSNMGSAMGSNMGSGMGSGMTMPDDMGTSGMGSAMGSNMGSAMGSNMGSAMGSNMGSGMTMPNGMSSSAMGSGGMGSNMGSGHPSGRMMTPGMRGQQRPEAAQPPVKQPTRVRTKNSKVQSLMPGISMLGQGTSDELIQLAQAEGIDVLVLFEVEVDENLRNGMIVNETRLELFDVAKEERIYRTSKINNVYVQTQLADGKDSPVIEVFDDLFQAIDQDSETRLKVRDFPTGIRPEHVKGRVVSLVTEAGEQRLRALAEVKFYNDRELVDDTVLVKACQKLVGELDGVTLVEGEKEERRDVADEMLASTADD